MSLDNLPEMLVPLISDTTSKKQELNISQSGLEDDSELHHIPAWHEPVRILYHFLNSIAFSFFIPPHQILQIFLPLMENWSIPRLYIQDLKIMTLRKPCSSTLNYLLSYAF